MSLKFQRTIENFVCGHCGLEVIGNGYTNHCPRCLYSRHVDINPGDRAADCGGLMKPVRVESRGTEWYLLQACKSCGFERRNKVAPEDNREVLLELAARKND